MATIQTTRRAPPAASARIARAAIAALWSTVRAALALRRQRDHLARLDDRLLADIGLTREAALCEARRRLWDVPAHWQEPCRGRR
ncbi:MAG: DUF1127 domain-containing protein [Gemmobacter sp.]